MNLRRWPAAATAFLLVTAARPARAQADSTHKPAPPAESTYAPAQAARGESVFRRVCAECHVQSLFEGAAFRRSWAGRPAYDLFELIRTTMPQDNPGRLRRQEYADVVTYFLKLSGARPDTIELAADVDALRRVSFPPLPDRRGQ
jgi:mono/diheme cytochrome c family protein